MSASRLFRCAPEAVTGVRRFVRGALDGYPRDTVEAAELMASELATNCVRHAHTDFELTIDTSRDVRVEVRDVGDGRPTMRSPAPRDASGRGLRIVQSLSDAWGVTPGAEGKTVWFTLYPGVARNPAAAAAPSEREAGAAGAADERAGEVEVRARVRDRQSFRGALRRLRGEPSTLSA